MATTTNYSWTTPDDTALVKDGASAIRTLGSSIDTSVKSLNPGTTAGDIDYYTSATAKARVGIGTNGQVLTSNGSTPSWATPSVGGMTLLSTTTLSGATVTISSISQAYKNLVIVVLSPTNATADGEFRCAPNGTTNQTDQVGTLLSNSSRIYDNDYLRFCATTINVARANTTASWASTIYNYASTTSSKPIQTFGNYVSGGNAFCVTFAGSFRSTTAISSLVFSNTGGNLSTGTVLLYGAN